MKKERNPGRKWPWIIIGSIFGIIALSYWTVTVALNNPVQMSDVNMQNYHDYDNNVNAFIKAKVAFDKHYSLLYMTEQFKPEAAVVRFKLTDKEGNPVNDAKMSLRLTRPNTHDYDMDVPVKSVEDGIYTFERTALPKAGRWDLLLHVAAGENERYMNLKADTRYSNVFEY